MEGSEAVQQLIEQLSLDNFIGTYGVKIPKLNLFIDDVLLTFVNAVSAVVTVLLSVFTYKTYKNSKQEKDVRRAVWTLKYIQVFTLLGLGAANFYLFYFTQKRYGVTERWKTCAISLFTGLSLAFTNSMDIAHYFEKAHYEN